MKTYTVVLTVLSMDDYRMYEEVTREVEANNLTHAKARAREMWPDAMAIKVVKR